MDAVVKWASRSGAKQEQLPKNYRSREVLIDLCNRLFSGVFSEHGMPPADVVVKVDRVRRAELEIVPAVGVFHLRATKGEAGAAIAAGIAAILARPDETPVLDRATACVRPVTPGDIAVLVAMNREAEAIARALAARGIRSVVARSGLMGTPEGTALGAALRYLLDERDALAVAELEALHGWDGLSPDAWLSRKLATRRAADAPPNRPPWRLRLDDLRSRAKILAPQELVEGVLIALDMTTLGARWPDPSMRIANLDALRKFARVYEQRCIDDGEGSSLAGLLRFLESLTQKTYRHGEERSADEQHASTDPDAVTIMTYHRSKGLEWPVVVLASLDRPTRRVGFDVEPECDASELEPDDPLAGRWIRYWPWPFGQLDAPLEDLVASSEVGQRLTERKTRERARLLYVGFTRARDHLIFAATISKAGVPVTNWLDELQHGGARAITLPLPDAAEPRVEIGTGADRIAVPARTWHLDPDPPPAMVDDSARKWFSRPGATERVPYWIQPSAASDAPVDHPRLVVGAVHTIHAPLVRGESPAVEWNKVGDALHAFLAADVEHLDARSRARIATRLLEGFGVLGAYSAESIVSAADAFRAFVAAQAPAARWRREIPIEARIDSPAGERKIDGRIDLLLETDDALIVVDHKSFPGVGEAVWRMKAETHAPQLATYLCALRRARPDKQLSAWLHFANAGAIVTLDAIG